MRIITQDRRSATCQPAELADAATLVLKWTPLLLSLTVNGRCTAAHVGPCQVWGGLVCPSRRPDFVLKRARLKWKSMFRFSGAWHRSGLSQAIKIDEVFITNSLVPALSKDHDHLSYWLCVWVRLRGRQREGEWVGERGPSLFQRSVFSNRARNHNASSAVQHRI